MQELDSKPDECISFYLVARCKSLVVPIIQDGTVQVRPARLVSGFTPYDIFPDTQKGILEIGCLFVCFNYLKMLNILYFNNSDGILNLLQTKEDGDYGIE